MQMKMIENIDESYENKEFRKNALKTLEKLDMPKWKRIKFQVDLPEEYREFKNFELKGEASLTMDGGIGSFEGVQKKSYLEKLNETFFNGGILIEEGNKDIHISYQMDDENNFLQDLNIIKVPEETSLNIIFEYSGNPEYGFRNSLSSIEAGEGSKVNIINLQMLGNKVESNNTIEVKASGRAEVNQYNLELGGGVTTASSAVFLNGNNIKSENYSIYIADGDKRTDLEYSTHHQGRRGESLIEGRGIVKDNSIKVFRGNLYFERGSGKSIGKEEETAVLMNKGVKADSIPTLFCKEDDVVGEHSASAGQLNENKLFYLMSRGLSEREAKKMVAISAFRPILEKINNKDIEKKVLEDIEKRI